MRLYRQNGTFWSVEVNTEGHWYTYKVYVDRDGKKKVKVLGKFLDLEMLQKPVTLCANTHALNFCAIIPPRKFNSMGGVICARL